jgi:hypothetical protein
MADGDIREMIARMTSTSDSDSMPTIIKCARCYSPRDHH